MYYTGFADEAGTGIEAQIKATKALGWTRIESRNIDGTNIHDLSDADFDRVAGILKDEGVTINCFGSTVANWSRDPRSEEDYQRSVDELKRAIPRMERLGCTMIRGMSFTRLRDASLYTEELEESIFKKVNALVSICEDAGIYYMHENCANYGGMSSDHTLRLLDHINSPNFKLVFDTGNPLNSIDYREGHQKSMQSAWQFYSAVKEFVAYVHIKDGRFVELQPDEIFNKAEWTFPGEGEGFVKEIVRDLLASGYEGGFSMEPHMQLVYHEDSGSAPEELKFNNYMEYGRRFMKIVEEAKAELTAAQA
ncbi:MAG: sugar phosphate isomerase/epimerase [Spirochaetales bacterium]|nr:sugar phosphate isomerase/epimerase [Spirochaetales bacterium]